MAEDFESIVSSLNEPQPGVLYVQKRDPRVTCVNVYAAKNVASSLEAIIVEAQPRLLPKVEEWPCSDGFEVSLRATDSRHGTVTLVCLDLTDAKYRDVFMSLAEDVCGSLAIISTEQEAIAELLRRLIRWQDFLNKHRVDGLSAEQQAGLFGELYVLQTTFLPHLNSVTALEGWRGCKKAHQDFQYPGFAIEVKTTRAVAPDKLTISNIQQLDEEDIDEMFLSLVWLHKNASTGTSLPAIIESIRSELSESAVHSFNDGLLEVGYLDRHKHLYEKELNQVRSVSVFLIESDFPRLTRQTLPEGIHGVTYQISIDACRPHELQASEFELKVERLGERLSNG